MENSTELTLLHSAHVTHVLATIRFFYLRAVGFSLARVCVCLCVNHGDTNRYTESGNDARVQTS